MVGRLPGGGFLDLCRRCPTAHGKSRSPIAQGLRAAHPLPAVLPGEERAAFDLRAGAEVLEMTKINQDSATPAAENFRSYEHVS
jgi:hypothetical protein